MSQTCPLCGKTKSQEALFCDDCAKKIHTEYEVDIPSGENIPVEKMLVEDERDAADHEVVVPVDRSPKKKKRGGVVLLVVLLLAVLIGGYYWYDTSVRKDNRDRGAWEAAVKTNSIQGYLTYMAENPKGGHFEEAQAELRRLKEEETAAWERMRVSDNVTELRDFLREHSESPYVTLVRSRLDSLAWMGALQSNTGESYADYMSLMEVGEIKGDYIAEAQKRFEMLSDAQTAVAAVVMDSIRATVDRFFIALSSLDHTGMLLYLAPTVQRFFNAGTAPSDKLVGELLVTGAKTEYVSLKWVPDLEALRCIQQENVYKVNVPLQKSYLKEENTVRVFGYIVHLEMDENLRIFNIFETKPYPEAP